jgi:hypothetical protein
MIRTKSVNARVGWGLVVLGCCLGGIQLTLAQAGKGIPVENLFPERTVFYVSQDGGEAHQEGWKKTASYEALYGSGLMAFLKDLFKDVVKQLDSMDDGFQHVLRGGELVLTKGYSSGICLMDAGMPVPVPQVVLVVHEGGELARGIAELVQKMPDLEEIQEEKIEGRTVRSLPIPDAPPGLVVGWWKEGSHLVVTAGLNAPRLLIAHLKGEGKSVVENPLWKRIQETREGYEVTARGWFDFGMIREAYGETPIPGNGVKEGVKVADAIEALGLAKIGPYVFTSGYEGRSLHAETDFELPEPREGIDGVAGSAELDDGGFAAVPGGEYEHFRGEPRSGAGVCRRDRDGEESGRIGGAGSGRAGGGAARFDSESGGVRSPGGFVELPGIDVGDVSGAAAGRAVRDGIFSGLFGAGSGEAAGYFGQPSGKGFAGGPGSAAIRPVDEGDEAGTGSDDVAVRRVSDTFIGDR